MKAHSPLLLMERPRLPRQRPRTWHFGTSLSVHPSVHMNNQGPLQLGILPQPASLLRPRPHPGRLRAPPSPRRPPGPAPHPGGLRTPPLTQAASGPRPHPGSLRAPPLTQAASGPRPHPGSHTAQTWCPLLSGSGRCRYICVCHRAVRPRTNQRPLRFRAAPAPAGEEGWRPSEPEGLRASQGDRRSTCQHSKPCRGLGEEVVEISAHRPRGAGGR